MLNRMWGYVALLVWGAAVLFLMGKTPYGLGEGAAKALVLDWSIGDQVASSVVTLGIPDMRAVLWLPLGFLWPGQLFAAKVFLVVLLALTARGLYLWRKSQGQEETALLATGLMLIAPLTLQQMDSLSTGIPLLMLFVLGAWMDQEYRKSPRPFGGMYFGQVVVCAFSISLHPAGLAYPLSLLWFWKKNPVSTRQQKYFYAGIAISVLLSIAIWQGWHGMGFWKEGLAPAAGVLFGPELESSAASIWAAGLVVALTLLVLFRSRMPDAFMNDLLGRTLVWAVLLGAVILDNAWGFLTLVLVLYGGLPVLLKPRVWFVGKSFLAQRGWLWVLMFLTCLVFTQGDRARYDQTRNHLLSLQDQLIETFAQNVEALRGAVVVKNEDAAALRVRVASQWPARTMMACRCDALPLPPATRDAKGQLAMMKGLTHLVFNPRDEANIALVQNLSQLGPDVETLSLQPAGVILKIRAPMRAPLPLEPAQPSGPPLTNLPAGPMK